MKRLLLVLNGVLLPEVANGRRPAEELLKQVLLAMCSSVLIVCVGYIGEYYCSILLSWHSYGWSDIQVLGHQCISCIPSIDMCLDG